MESKHSLRMMKKIMAVLRQPGGSAEAVLALHADPPRPPHTPTNAPSAPSSSWEQEHSCAGRQSRDRRRGGGEQGEEGRIEEDWEEVG